MQTFTVRLRHDKGIIAIKTTSSDWLRAVQQVLKAEHAPQSAFVSCLTHIQAGEKLWHGGIVTKGQADAYNAAQEKIYSLRAIGKTPPDNLLNGAHNLLAGALV
jgi:hypothetical protein